jgi:hypothetical protein
MMRSARSEMGFSWGVLYLGNAGNAVLDSIPRDIKNRVLEREQPGRCCLVSKNGVLRVSRKK